MPSFLDVDLEQIAQIVERRSAETEVALLLDRSRLRIALRHDQAPQVGAMLTRDFLPCRLALVRAEVDSAIRFLRREEDAPAIVRHLHVIEMGPTPRVDRHCGAQ